MIPQDQYIDDLKPIQPTEELDVQETLRNLESRIQKLE